MRFVLASLGGAMVVLAGRSSLAAPTSQLVYSRGAGAESCPEEDGLHRAVAARIGYDPFLAWASRTVVASLHKQGRGFLAQVYLIDAKGLSHGAREFSTEGECSELINAVALAVAIAIEPNSAVRVAATDTAPAPASKPTPERTPTPVRPPAPARELTPARPFDVEVAAGVVGSLGAAPSPATGGSLGGGIRWPSFSASIEARVDVPAGNGARSTGEVSLWTALGGIVPCVHLRPLFACALAEIATVQASSPAPNSHSQSFFWWGGGARVGVLVPVAQAVAIRLRSDVVANLAPYNVVVQGTTAWKNWPAVISFASDAVVHFP